ncbi:hypothetical protein [Mesorhizobium sp.]|uniref:hypothetical protein n=1 Tax=Mesorhizobium sp. TaxID=1871066 RepID=UPI0025B847E3|nr:hypothetical protein [Mesorhizobium sp.]
MLHDAHIDIRTRPTNSPARMPCRASGAGFLRTNPAWALSRPGLLALRGREGQGDGRNGADAGRTATGAAAAAAGLDDDAGDSVLADETEQMDALSEELAEIDAVLARSSRLLAGEDLVPRSADGLAVDTAGQGGQTRARPCRTASGR